MNECGLGARGNLSVGSLYLYSYMVAVANISKDHQTKDPTVAAHSCGAKHHVLSKLGILVCESSAP